MKAIVNFLSGAWNWMKYSSLFWTIAGASLTFLLWVTKFPTWIVIMVAILTFLYLIWLDAFHHANTLIK
jgi:uncharacterized membrane protein